MGEGRGGLRLHGLQSQTGFLQGQPPVRRGRQRLHTWAALQVGPMLALSLWGGLQFSCPKGSAREPLSWVLTPKRDHRGRASLQLGS